MKTVLEFDLNNLSIQEQYWLGDLIEQGRAKPVKVTSAETFKRCEYLKRQIRSTSDRELTRRWNKELEYLEGE